MIPVNADTLRAIAPRFTPANAMRQAIIIEQVGAVLAQVLESYAIATPLRIGHFLGQVCHESAGFRTTEEFADGRAYEGRSDLGNKFPGDGPRYKGRGLLQLTGRANYRAMGITLHMDLEGNPALAAEPALSLRIACEYWKSRNINNAADRDDIAVVTRLINGGYNGIEERRKYTDAAMRAVEALPPDFSDVKGGVA